MIAALAALFVSPVELTLSTPKTVAPGDEVVLEATVKNVSKTPVTFVVTSGPNLSLGLRVESQLQSPVGEIHPDSANPLIGQWFRAYQIGTGSFVTLKPGETYSLYRETFTQIFSTGKPSGLISERAKAPRGALQPGTYRWRFSYRLNQKDLDQTNPKLAFHPLAKPMFDHAFSNPLTAETTFRVDRRI